MKNRFLAIAFVLLGTFSLLSCIDPDQSQEVIFKRDVEAIESYLKANPIAGVKEYNEKAEGFYLFWQVSKDPNLNDKILQLDTVKFNYTGKQLSNAVFATSIEQVAKDNGFFQAGNSYRPIELIMGHPSRGGIPGVEFALSLMKEGEKATVIFPSRLGYGSQASGPVPANSPLIFELELIQAKKGVNHLKP